MGSAEAIAPKALYALPNIGALPASVLQALSADTIESLSSAQVLSLTPANIGALTTEQYVALTSNQLAALRSSQVAAIAPDDAVAIGSEDIAALPSIGSLSSASFAALTDDQLQALTTAQYVQATGAQFAALNAAQVSAIQTDDVVAIGSADIKSLTAIAALSSGAVTALTTGEIAALSTPQIQALTTTQFSLLTSTQFEGLIGTQFASLSTSKVQLISPDQVVAIGTADIRQLGNIRGLQTTTVAALTSAEASALLTSQLSALTSNQVVALDQVVGLSLSPSQLAALEVSLDAIRAAEVPLEQLTPLALDLNGDGLRSISAVAGVVFDVNADGQAERVGWLSTSDAWLGLDRNGNGLIDDGSELFGSGTTLPDGSKALDGFAALRVLDSNQDGVIDPNDADFAGLSVWVDRNTNAKTDPGELRSLAQAGVQSLSLAAKPTAIVDQGNLIGLMGTYTTTDGRTHELSDIWLSANPLRARVVDLSTLDQGPTASGTLARITFKGNHAGDTLRVSLNDVLVFGEADVAAGLPVGSAGQSIGNGPQSRQMLVNGDVQDTVQLADAAGWTMAGTAIIGNASYKVLSQGLAQLLVEDKVKIVAV